MQYDPIKELLGRFFNRSVLLRILFYRLLNVLLLRSWHIRRELKYFLNHRPIGTVINVLDAGCGFGQYTWVIARRRKNWIVDGIEIKQEQVDDCKTFFKKIGLENTDFYLANLVDYKKPGCYTLIISVDVMEHIENDLQVFRNFYESLTPGGCLLISTPSDLGGSDVSIGQHQSFIDEHVRNGYPAGEIENKLRTAGFESISVKYSYGWPGNLAWKFSMKYPLLLLAYSKYLLLLLPLYYLVVFPVCLVLNFLDLKCFHRSGTGLIVRAIKAPKQQ